MIADELARIISDEWTIQPDTINTDIEIRPKERMITADKFDKQLSRLSRYLKEEPYKSIDENSLFASFHSYFDINDYRSHIGIYLISTNSESCDIVTREETVTKTETIKELTGYCKALSEKKYLIHAS